MVHRGRTLAAHRQTASLTHFSSGFGTFELPNVICLLSVFTPSIEEVWEVLTQHGGTRLFLGITFPFGAFPLHGNNFAIQDSNLCFISCQSHSFNIKSDVTDKESPIVVLYMFVAIWLSLLFFPSHKVR